MAIGATFVAPRIPQDPAYHNFADHRRWFGIPNCLDVVSNVPFLIVGLSGLLFLLGAESDPQGGRFSDPREKLPYAVFFAGVALTSLGSAYYHWNPTNERLMWDRLPMAIAFMSILAACVVERVGVKVGLVLLAPLAAYGAGSVIAWHVTELRGAGDLRAYLLAQFLPPVLILMMMAMFPSRYTRGSDLLAAIGLYILAKLLESFDRPIFSVGHIVSGHTLKHLAAAVSAYWVLRMLRLRSVAVKRT
jgi:hypothetical protein